MSDFDVDEDVSVDDSYSKLKFRRRNYDSLSDVQFRTFLGMYRWLRCPIPMGNQCPGKPWFIGQTREAARETIISVARELDWIEYLASK